MKRSLVAVVWIAGSTLPLLAATVFLIGCCVLPFHRVIHEAVPLCHMAVKAQETHETTPAQPKEDPVKRIVVETPQTFRFVASTKAEALVSVAPAAHRNFITLGAMRCDQDVGLHVFVQTFLI